MIANKVTKTISIKLCYYGPPQSGKSESAKTAYESCPINNRNEIVSLADANNAIFDYFSIVTTSSKNIYINCDVFTVPSGPYSIKTRKQLLSNCDGLIFVASSEPEDEKANLDSLEELRNIMAGYGELLEEFPLVFQYNKQDIIGALPPKFLHHQLNTFGVDEYETVAIDRDPESNTVKALQSLFSLIVASKPFRDNTNKIL